MSIAQEYSNNLDELFARFEQDEKYNPTELAEAHQEASELVRMFFKAINPLTRRTA